MVLESFLIANDFDCHHLMFFMVKTFECLAETTAADLVKDFVPKGKLVFHDNLIITSVIVKAKVVAVLG